MKPVNIYALTRVSDPARIERLERQMSGRGRFMKVKEWEMRSLRSFCEGLCSVMPGAVGLEFFFSFTLPKLGKEFDLLRINKSTVINVELKSESVSDDAIRKQLLQNKYYLTMLGKTMIFFTYVSSIGRLVRLSNSGRLVEAGWEDLATALSRQQGCYSGDIEELFKENQYLISPLTDPGRFLRGDYFLTSQQRDIKKKIISLIKKTTCSIQGFTGLPGTGKTILLYDLAMTLSENESVCLFHFGARSKEFDQLNERLKRVDFYYCEADDMPQVEKAYRAIFVDEGHRIEEKALEEILALSKEWRAPVIFSYDSEVPIASEERKKRSTNRLESIPGFIRYQLTNRIRLNNEMSAFIQCLMCVKEPNHRRDYPNVSLLYANDENEAAILRQNLMDEGYIYIRDRLVEEKDPVTNGTQPEEVEEKSIMDVRAATSREFEAVVMSVDDSFYYDERGYLRAKNTGDGRVRHLYHGLNRAKQKIAVIVKDNPHVFDRLLGLIQKKG